MSESFLIQYYGPNLHLCEKTPLCSAEAVAKLVDLKMDLRLAHTCTGLFGEPLRRKVAERLALRPHSNRELSLEFPEYTIGDIQHRIRGLIAGAVATTLPGRKSALLPNALKESARYFDFLTTLSSLSAITGTQQMDLDKVFSALSDPVRRLIFEHVVVLPDTVMELSRRSGELHGNVSYHVTVLTEAGLVCRVSGKIAPAANYLPSLRMYFERLWVESELGEGWIRRRQVEASDYGI